MTDELLSITAAVYVLSVGGVAVQHLSAVRTRLLYRKRLSLALPVVVGEVDGVLLVPATPGLTDKGHMFSSYY